MNGSSVTGAAASRQTSATFQVRRRAVAGAYLIGHTLLLSHLTFVPYAYAGPAGGAIVGGAGEIQHSGLTTNIHQQSNSLSINWNSFDVNRDEVVNFLQPSASSIALNRIVGNNASQIFGQINANGQVILVNPNGIFFGNSARLDVGGLIASGLDISPEDFMRGDYLFRGALGADGTVMNSGIINAAVGGNVTLLGSQVKNEGVIVANLGAVNLAAGKEAVLTFDNDGLVGIRITKAVLQDELGVDAAVINSGEIAANGGRILLTASQSRDVFSQAVNTGGMKQATSVVVNEDGTFTLGSGADVVNSGMLDVSASETAGNGGSAVLIGENVTSSGTVKADAYRGDGGEIELHAADTTLVTADSVTSARSESGGRGGVAKILGDKVGLFDRSVVDVSGANGGGQALIGGDYQGSNDSIRNATRTYVGRQAQIHADAHLRGDGGKVITWGSKATWFYGSASSRGGEEAGNGGLVEISGKGLAFDGQVRVTAARGQLGTLLFDPGNIVIHDDSEGITTNDGEFSRDDEILERDGGASTFDISEGVLESLAFDANIVLQASDTITVNNLNDPNDPTDNSLTLKSTTGSLTISAGNSFIMSDPTDTIKTQGGAITITAAQSIQAGNFDTQGGAGQRGGNVSLAVTDANGGISVGSIVTNGGAAVAEGGVNGNAGNIHLSAPGTITVNGELAANGGAAGTGTVGSGGEIKIGRIDHFGNLFASSGAVSTGAITAHGANVSILAASGDANTASIATGAIDTSGVAAQSGGDVSLTATGTYGGVQVAGGIDAKSGITAIGGTDGGVIKVDSGSGGIAVAGALNSSVSATGDAAGTIDLSAVGAITVGDLIATRGTAPTGGNIRIGDIDFDRDIVNASGAVSTGAITGHGTAVRINAASVATGAIDTSGLSGQTGGDVSLAATNTVNVAGAINSQGGTTGKSGGDISLVSRSAGVVVNGEVNANGGTGNLGGNGGQAGAITITAATSSDITLGGSVSAHGGTALSGTAGEGNAVNIRARNLLFAPGLTSLTIGAGTNADVAITGNIDYDGIGGDRNLTIGAGNDVTITGNIRDGSAATADRLAVMLTGGSAVRVTGSTTTRGGSVSIGGASINTAAITTTGTAGQAGGGVSLASSGGAINVGAITAKGGLAVTAGAGNQGGNVSLNSTGGGITVAAIDSSGSAADAGAGGNAGTISATSSGDMRLRNNLSANGGRGVGEVDGNAARIALQATGGTLELQGDLLAQGNVPAQANQSPDITVSAQTVKINGSAAQRMEGNNVSVTSSSPLELTRSLTVSARNSAVLSGGVNYTGIGVGSLAVNAGNGVTLTGDIWGSNTDQLNVSLWGNSDLNSVGNARVTGATVTHGGSLTMDGVSVNAGSLDTSGRIGEKGGDVALTASSGGITVTSVTSTGGAASPASGGNDGGSITLDSDTGAILVDGAITSSGSIGEGADGNAGAITVTADNGSVQVAGNIAAQGASLGSGKQGDGANVALHAHNGALTLGGSLSAQGANSGDVILDAYVLGTGLPSINGNTIDITLATALNLQNSLTLTAGADAKINVDINYIGAGAGTLTIEAGDNIVLAGPVATSRGPLSVALRGGRDAEDQITVGGNITTGGGSFFASAANYDEHAHTVTTGAGAATINVDGDAVLGAMNVGSLNVDAGDAITQAGDIAVTGIADFSGRALTLKGALSAGAIETDVEDLTLDGVTSALAIHEANDIALAGTNSLIDTGALTLNADGSIAQVDLATLSSASLLTLSAGGDIVLGGGNALTGGVHLTAGGDATLANNADVQLVNVSAYALNISSTGAITQTGALNVNAFTADAASVNIENASALSVGNVTASGDVAVKAHGDLNVGGTVAGGGNVTFTADEDVDVLGSVTSGGILDVDAVNGSITDSANTGSVKLAAERIVLKANSNIGSVDSAWRTSGLLETRTAALNAQVTNGMIGIANSGDVTLEMVKATERIHLENEGDITIDRVETSTGTANGQVFLNARGNILGFGDKPPYTEKDADVAANSATLYALGGNLGEADRPLVVYVPGDISLVGVVNFDTVYLPPDAPADRVHDGSFVQFSMFDILTALAGEQVTQVEDLESLDPAIFTEIHHYNLSDISILMPPDQRYDEREDGR